MDLTNIITEILSSLTVKPSCILLSGSRCLPYINNPKDTEIDIITADKWAVINELKDIRKKYKVDNISIINYFDLNSNEAFIYLDHFVQVLWGEKTSTIDILNNKESYYNILKDKAAQKYNKTIKYFYHILTGIYILENNSFDFTEEQINNINILHNAEDLEACNTLINWIYFDYFKLHPINEDSSDDSDN